MRRWDRNLKNYTLRTAYCISNARRCAASGVATMCRTGYSRWSRTDTFTEAEFRLRGNEEFVVVTLTDLSGRKAVSQAYWLA